MRDRRGLIGTTLAIFVLAVVAQFDSLMSPAVAAVQHSFPSADASSVESIVSIGASTSMLAALVTGKLLQKVTFRAIGTAGCLIIALGGLLPLALHDQVAVLLVLAGITGIGVGVVTTVMPSMAARVFKGERLQGILGKVTALKGASSAATACIGGVIATYSWVLNYWLYSFALVALVLVVIFAPNERAGQQADGSHELRQAIPEAKQSISSIFICLMLGFLCTLLVAVMYNKIAVYLDTYNLGGSNVAGFALMFNMFSSIVVGVTINQLKRIFKNFTLAFGFFLIAIGALLFITTRSLPLVCLAAFCVGAGNNVSMTFCPYILSNITAQKQFPLVMGLFSACSSLGFTSSTWVFKVLSDLVGLDPVEGTFLAMLVISVLAGVLLTLFRFQKRVVTHYLYK